MIVVDSSAWTAHLRNTDSVSVGKLRHLDDTQEIPVGDLILLEVLQGARNEPHAQLIERPSTVRYCADVGSGDGSRS